MKPIEFKEQNCVYAKDQKEYLPLFASIGGSKSKRKITPEQQKKMQEARRKNTT